MKQNIKKLTAFVATAAITLSGTSVTALAAKDGSKTVAGLEDIDLKAKTSETETVETDTTETPAASDSSAFVNKEAVGTTGFAVCEDAVNIREAAGTDSSVIGTIKSLGSVEILDVDESGWYQIKSGDVEGYINAEYVATGNNAEELKADAGYTTAEVGAEILNIRQDADSDSDIVAIAGSDEKLEVVADNGDWIKVVSEDGVYGWVSCEYVFTSTEYATAVPVDEQADVTEEAAADSADDSDYSYTDNADYSYADNTDYSYTDNAGYSYTDNADYSYTDNADYSYTDNTDYSYTDNADYSYTDNTDYSYTDNTDYSYTDNTDYSYTEPDYSSSAYTGSGDAQADAESLYQVYLEAQAAADAAVANAEGEQKITETAAAAQSAYAAYLAAQNAADEAWVNGGYQTAAAENDTAAAQTYDDTTYEETNDDTVYEETYDDTVYEETYDDTVYEESYDDSSYDDGTSADSSSSSLGASIAAYACQFVGNPYVWGGSSLTNGADCSGFTMAVYSNFGISLPHSAEAQSGYGTPVSLDALQPGDLLFYYGDGGIGHVTMYIGNGQVVHASSSTTGIIISDVNYRTPCGATRLV